MITASRWTRLLATASAVVLISMIIPSLNASAQAPVPNVYMQQFAPGATLTSGPSAYIVEGLGSLGGCPYTEASIEASTVTQVNDGIQTITEISPQDGYDGSSDCGSLSQYEALFNQIEKYVEAHAATNSPRYWGGFMIDEEACYATASFYESLNSYVETVMTGTSGISWIFTEDGPQCAAGDWTPAVYNTIIQGTWAAPQMYNQNVNALANTDCATYDDCINDVTVDNYSGYAPWNSYTYSEGQTNGVPWSDAIWGSGYWHNEFCSTACTTIF